MTEEKAMKATELMNELVNERNRRNYLKLIKEKDLYNDESILYTVKENWDIFGPTFKEYAEKVMDKAIEEKKANIDRLRKMLEEL